MSTEIAFYIYAYVYPVYLNKQIIKLYKQYTYKHNTCMICLC